MRKLLLIGFRKDRDSMFLQQLKGADALCTVVCEEQDLKELLQSSRETLVIMKIRDREQDSRFLRQIRETEEGIPVIVIGQMRDAEERIYWLEQGAYDGISRDCSWGELTARLHAALRRF